MTSLAMGIRDVAEEIFDRYAYPAWLREHSLLAGRVAEALAGAHQARGADLVVEDVALAGYLHDIGRSPLLAGIRAAHHQLSVSVVLAEGRGTLAEMVRRHSVYAPLHPALTPRTLAEKIVNVADRRSGQQLLDVRRRISEMSARYPEFASDVPRVLVAALALEAEVFAGLPFGPADLAGALG